MPDIAFSCPKCKQELVYDKAWAGMRDVCPACGESVIVPKEAMGMLSINPSDVVVEVVFTCPGCLMEFRTPGELSEHKSTCPDCPTPVVPKPDVPPASFPITEPTVPPATSSTSLSWAMFSEYFEKREGFVPVRGDSRVEDLYAYYCCGLYDAGRKQR